MSGATFERRDLFGGKGRVAIADLLGATQAAPFQAVLQCELEAGGVVGAHVQQEHPEIIIGLFGEGEATVSGETHRLEAGDVVYLAHGQTLSLRNASDAQPLGYLIIKAKSS